MRMLGWNLARLSKALSTSRLPDVEPGRAHPKGARRHGSLANGTAEHRGAAADIGATQVRNLTFSGPSRADANSTSVIRGLPIVRPLPPSVEVPAFVHWMQEHGFTGERTWEAMSSFYLWFCKDQGRVPLPATMEARFARELAKLCPRGQIRLRQNGKLRRLRTYTIPDFKPAHLGVAE